MEPATSPEISGPIAFPGPLQLLAREGHERLAHALRELLNALPDPTPRTLTAAELEEDSRVVFTPFRPPPLDQGTWMDRARQVAIAQAVLRREASPAAREWLEERCGLRFDEAQVERAALTLDTQIRAWRKRRLPKPFWLFIHSWRERVFQPSGVECWPATLVVGVDQHGYRVVADFVLGPAGEPHWQELFRSLEHRGVTLTGGGITARMIPELFEAAQAHWPNAHYQVCQRQFQSRFSEKKKGAGRARRISSIFQGPFNEILASLKEQLPNHSPLQMWCRAPKPGEPSVISTATLPSDLLAPLGSIQWMEREVRSWRNKAIKDDLPVGPNMKARLLTAAAIEWENTLDVRKPFISAEAIYEALHQNHSTHPVHS